MPTTAAQFEASATVTTRVATGYRSRPVRFQAEMISAEVGYSDDGRKVVHYCGKGEWDEVPMCVYRAR